MDYLCIYAIDVARITGKSHRTGNNILTRIRKEKGKLKGQCVTLRELCEYLQISYEEAEQFLAKAAAKEEARKKAKLEKQNV